MGHLSVRYVFLMITTLYISLIVPPRTRLVVQASCGVLILMIFVVGDRYSVAISAPVKYTVFLRDLRARSRINYPILTDACSPVGPKKSYPRDVRFL